jgi:hypothetical protein
MLAGAQGLPAEWEVRDLALSLARQMESLGPAIEAFDTARWRERGASATYAEQRELVAREAGYAAAAARELAERPSGLGKAFELHLRVQSVESLVSSLAAGAHTYQPEAPAAALEILGAAAPEQTKLRGYVMELASAKEQELAAIDQEAQRCRAELLRAPAPETRRRNRQ